MRYRNIQDEVEEYVQTRLEDTPMDLLLEEHDMDPLEAVMILWKQGLIYFPEVEDIEEYGED